MDLFYFSPAMNSCTVFVCGNRRCLDDRAGVLAPRSAGGHALGHFRRVLGLPVGPKPPNT